MQSQVRATAALLLENILLSGTITADSMEGLPAAAFLKRHDA